MRRPMRNSGQQRAEPRLTTGTIAPLILIGTYPTSSWIAWPHSWAATPMAATDSEP